MTEPKGLAEVQRYKRKQGGGGGGGRGGPSAEVFGAVHGKTAAGRDIPREPQVGHMLG